MPICPYYTKRCRILAPCCGKLVCCHRCHNNESDHTLPRNELQLVVCDTCSYQQYIAQGDTCLRCGELFARYFCTSCGIANDDIPAMGYFHCSKCGICRIGSSTDFFHCDGCNCCLRLEMHGEHICHADCLDGACPICGRGPMFDSQSAAHKLPCGHMAHMACIQQTSQPLYNICTLCNSSGTSDSNMQGESSKTAGSRRASTSTSAAGSNNRTQGSRSRYPVSSLVAHLAKLLTDSSCASSQKEDELVDMLQELEEKQLLSGQKLSDHEVLHYTALKHPANCTATLKSDPTHFRRLLEDAIVHSVLNTRDEIEATGRAIDTVVQILQQNSSALRLQPGQAVTVDRTTIAGSVGKSVSVQGQFDVDLVVFMNLPADVLRRVDIYDPDSTHNSEWMQQLRQQVCKLLQQQLCSSRSPVRCISPPAIQRVAINFSTLVRTSNGRSVELEFDVVLAPNLAPAADRVAAAWPAFMPGLPLAVQASTPAEKQCAVVLAPILKIADSILAAKSADTPGSLSVDGTNASNFFRTVSAASCASISPRAVADRLRPSCCRNIWLAEAATDFVKQAAIAAAYRGGISGRVVTSTVRLIKAWARKGLQGAGQRSEQHAYKQLKSFTLELIVLHAAEKLAKKLSNSTSNGLQPAEQAVHRGRYVLDLLLEVLDVVQLWAAAARRSSTLPGMPRYDLGPVLFTELAGGRYYSRHQAVALLQLQDAMPEIWGNNCTTPPLVLHPVDPLNSVFDQRQPEALPCKVWVQFGEAAGQLKYELENYDWGHIMSKSTLAAALLA